LRVNRSTTIVLARHGQSESNNQGLVTGQLDPGLSDKGRQQAGALAQCLEREPLAAIYASTLVRTAQTAQPASAVKGLAIERMAALNEIHMGELQGRHRDERDPPAQALWARWQADPWGFCVPGGERFDAFARRVQGALRTILGRHPDQTVLIVGHRATNRVLLGTLLGWPHERWIELRLRSKFFYAIEPGEPPRVTTCALGGSKSGQRVEGLVM
jgi:broad specificity phosphatase PhoE